MKNSFEKETTYHTHSSASGASSRHFSLLSKAAQPLRGFRAPGAASAAVARSTVESAN